MAITRTIARLNKVGLNRITAQMAPTARGFGLVVHTGRRSGARYETPVNVFKTPGGYRIALTYGTESDWVRNVLAAGSFELKTQGHTVHAVAPRLVHDEKLVGLPHPARDILRLLRVADFIDIDANVG